jgi:putative OPT family oligopeptide transporter
MQRGEETRRDLKFTDLVRSFVFERKEVTLRAVLMGLVFGAVLASSNVYLAMKVGAFNPGSIPGAILGSGILHALGSKALIFEANIIQTITSAGANFSGAFFDSIPVAASFGKMPGYLELFAYLAFGGMIGISLTVLFRRYLVVEEKLPYPNGIAVANTLEVVSKGKEASRKMKILFYGLLLSSALVFLQSPLAGAILPWSLDFTSFLPEGFMFGLALSPLLIGFGFMMGLKSAVGYFLGNVLAGLILGPLLYHRGVVDEVAWAPVAKVLASPASGLLIGGTLLSMAVSYRSILRAFRALSSMSVRTGRDERDLHDRDLPLWVPLSIVLFGTVGLGLFFGKFASVLAFPLIVVCAFLFSLVAARTTGETGLCPTSLFVWVAMAIIGTVVTKKPEVIAFLAGIIAVAVGQASDSMNDLKTGYLIKATPASQQLVQYVGLLGGALAAPLAFVAIVEAYGIFNEQFPVPFGMVAKEIVISVSQGVNPFNGLTLSLGLVGGGLLSLFHLPALPIGLGMFAPVTFGLTVLIGGVVRKVVASRGARTEDDGIAFFSGMLAGEGIMGVLIAAVVAFLL